MPDRPGYSELTYSGETVVNEGYCAHCELGPGMHPRPIEPRISGRFQGGTASAKEVPRSAPYGAMTFVSMSSMKNRGIAVKETHAPAPTNTGRMIDRRRLLADASILTGGAVAAAVLGPGSALASST